MRTLSLSTFYYSPAYSQYLSAHRVPASTMAYNACTEAVDMFFVRSSVYSSAVRGSNLALAAVCMGFVTLNVWATLGATFISTAAGAAITPALVFFVQNVLDAALSAVGGVLGSAYSSWRGMYAPLMQFSLLSNPTTDIDLSTNTDCEDMLAFFGDIVEFTEQDKALLVDAAFDMWFTSNWSVALGALELVLMRLLSRNLLSVFLAKFCGV